MDHCYTEWGLGILRDRWVQAAPGKKRQSVISFNIMRLKWKYSRMNGIISPPLSFWMWSRSSVWNDRMNEWNKGEKRNNWKKKRQLYNKQKIEIHPVSLGSVCLRVQLIKFRCAWFAPAGSCALVERWPWSVCEEACSHQRNGYLPEPSAGRHQSANMCIHVVLI